MGKYKLTSLLEIVSSSRVGTIKDSFRDLKVIIDRIDDEDLAYVREDYDADEFGKVHYEAKVVYGDQKDQFFTVYDYKFGYDPTTEEYAEEEQDWSLGAPESTREEGIRKAEELGFNVSRKGRLEEIAGITDPALYETFLTIIGVLGAGAGAASAAEYLSKHSDKLIDWVADNAPKYLDKVKDYISKKVNEDKKNKDEKPKPTDYEDIMPAFSDDAGPRE